MRPTLVIPIASLILTTALAPAAVGAIELASCGNDSLGANARCGELTVPENRARPDGRTITLRILVLPATGTNSKEPLFMLAGGPGQGATDLTSLATSVFADVREHRDIVFVDQRGTGGSHRIDCPVDAAETPQSVFGALFDPDRARACLERIEEYADPTQYTTDIVVDDLEAVSEALGYPKVFLWGGSGGTRTALVWMRRYPERVAGALLDGVTPTDFRAPSTMARGCQETLEKVFAECRAQNACRAAYPDLEEDFRGLLQLFAKGPVTTYVLDPQERKMPVEMHRGDFVYAIRGIIYSSRTLARLPAMIRDAASTGDLHAFAQAYWSRQVGLRPYVAMGVHFGIYCSEDLPFIAEDEVEGFTKGTFVGRYLYDQYRGACRAWRAEPVDASFLEPVESEVPVLIFSGYYDPSTPPILGDRVAEHLTDSRHVVVRNESHGAEFGCGRQAAIDFLIRGSLDDLGPICEDQEPIQYEVGS